MSPPSGSRRTSTSTTASPSRRPRPSPRPRSTCEHRPHPDLPQRRPPRRAPHPHREVHPRPRPRLGERRRHRQAAPAGSSSGPCTRPPPPAPGSPAVPATSGRTRDRPHVDADTTQEHTVIGRLVTVLTRLACRIGHHYYLSTGCLHDQHDYCQNTEDRPDPNSRPPASSALRPASAPATEPPDRREGSPVTPRTRSRLQAAAQQTRRTATGAPARTDRHPAHVAARRAVGRTSASRPAQGESRPPGAAAATHRQAAAGHALVRPRRPPGDPAPRQLHPRPARHRSLHHRAVPLSASRQGARQ